jgi:hypothetical protein
MSKPKIAGMVVGLALLVVVVGWASTAPYLSNSGLGRTPGIMIGGTITPAMDDFSPLNDSVRGPLKFKLSGFPPFVNYLSWVGTPDGVITATRPDNGYWASRVRGNPNGWVRFDEETYALQATEIFGDARLPMLEAYGANNGMQMRYDFEGEVVVGQNEPLYTWEVFYWTTR